MASYFIKCSTILLAVLAFNIDSFAQLSPEYRDGLIKEFDKKMPAYLDEFIVPGAAVALIENGEIILQKGYGYADVKNKIKVDNQTGFNIASISKTVSAWGVMKLVEEGKIDLDSPAEKYLTRWHLPESDFDAKKVTIRRLLSHTAGLSLHGYPGWAPADTLPTIEESLSGKNNGASDVRIISEPGTEWRYSGGGYTMLQLIIEEVSGRSFEEYMQTEILNPLGMKNSSFKIDDKIMAASSKEHDAFGDEILFELFTAKAAAGLHTTIEDLTIFALASLNVPIGAGKKQTVLKQETIEQMSKPAPASGDRYGLGYFISRTPDESQVLVGHSGANDGWQSKLLVNQKTGDGFVVITNGRSGFSLLDQAYCDWVIWKNWANTDFSMKKSVTSLFINTLQKEGIAATTAKIKQVKNHESDSYWISENVINLFGYELLWADMPKEALEIFKVNIELYPKAFNTYDSYGEALLEIGKEKEAIENYIKSVKLNPGNENGIKVLKDLGVNTDELMVTVPVEDLKPLAGEYEAIKLPPGRDEWKVVITFEKDQLLGEDNGYRYRLVPLGDDKFVNPEDGASINFKTADKKNIKLVLFEEYEFKKVK